MSEVPPVPETPLARRRWVWYTLALVLVAGGISWVKVWRPLQLTHQHGAVRARIEQHLQKAMREIPSGPLRNVPERAQVCEYALSTIHYAVANKLWYRKDVYPEKFAALADRLEAGQGPDLRTLEGCEQLRQLLGETSPTFPRDDLSAELRGMVNELKAPPPPRR
jgi:hypothetical protein